MATSRATGAGPNGPRPRARGTAARREKPDLEGLSQLSGTLTAMDPQEHDPKRRSVYIDGRFVLGLHEESIILAGLKVGRAVDGPRLVEALRRDLAKKAWDEALGMLAATSRSRREVERKLSARYEAELVAEVLERLVRGGWLDDAEFARGYVRSHSQYGQHRLLQDLARRGVPRDVAAAVVTEQLVEVDAAEQAREAAAARLAKMPGVDRETAQRRLSGFLARRGYGFDAISRALESLLRDLPRAPQKSRTGRWGRRSGEEDD